MPKAYDIKRNYYADLELPQSATIDDIRKQYRKLALVWHPDRNAGKEADVVPRFQAIQAAHEILCDPVQKAQYDADRRVAGPFTSASTTTTAGTRGNPYQAKSAYPPPPRRTAPGTYTRPPTAQRPPASGADRFSNFQNGRTASGSAKDPANERTNAFSAWQSMQNNQRKATGPGSSTPNAAPRRPAPPPRTGTKYPSEERLREEHRYTPDEAQTRKDAWQAFRKQHGADAGPSSPGVKRSNTARTPRKQGFDPSAPGSDERPVSGHYNQRHRSEDFGRPDMSSKGSPSARRPTLDPTNPYPRQQDADSAPFAEANRRRTPYSSFIGEKTDFASDMRRSKSTRDTTKLNGDNDETRARSTSPKSTTRKANTFEFPAAQSDDDSSKATSSEEAVSPSKPAASPNSRPKKVPSSRRNGAPPNPPAEDNGEKAKSPPIFDFNNEGPAPFIPPTLPTQKSRSEEHINTRFSQDFSGFFASPVENSSPTRPTTRKGPASFTRQNSKGSARLTPTFGQPTSLGGRYTNLPPPPPNPPGSAPNSATTPQYSPAEWAAHFADGSWAVPPPPPRDNLTPQPQSVSPTDKAQDSGFSSADGDQMDIDDNPPATTVPPLPPRNDAEAMPPPPRPPRMVQVPPSQWHQAKTAQATMSMPSDEPSLTANLDDLAHVEPLGKTGDTGLQDLSDIGSTLPFESKAARRETPAEEGSDRVPAIPRPPTVPQSITSQTWAVYSAEFVRYVKTFQEFNGRYLSHFVARQTAIEGKMSGGMGWLLASGDTAGSAALNGPTGFNAYLRETEGDAVIRETWALGCERHLAAVKSFGEVREKVRRLVEGGGLPDR